MDNYDDLITALKRDSVWVNIDFKPFIEHFKQTDKAFAKITTEATCYKTKKERINRCLTRTKDRHAAKQFPYVNAEIPARLNIFIKEPININRILHILFIVQPICESTHRIDFRTSVCCPILCNNKHDFLATINNRIIVDLKHKNIYKLMSTHKIFNPQVIADGMFVSKPRSGLVAVQGTITRHEAMHLLCLIDEIYKLNMCNMCVYLTFAFLMYECTPLIQLKEQMVDIGDEYMANSALMGITPDPFTLFKKTKKNEYLCLLSFQVGEYAGWYSDFISIFKSNISDNKLDVDTYFEPYENDDPTTLNYTLKLDKLTDIESVYTGIGFKFYCKEYDWLIPHIIERKGTHELNIKKFHSYIMLDARRPPNFYILALTAHTSVFKYLLSCEMEPIWRKNELEQQALNKILTG